MKTRILVCLACFLLFSCAGTPSGRGTDAGSSSARTEPSAAEKKAAAADSAASGSTAAAAAKPASAAASAKPGPPFPGPFKPFFAVDGLVFAVPDPVLRWEPLPEGVKLRVQVAKSVDFSDSSLHLDAETGGSFYRLEKPLEADTVYFARARRKSSRGEQEDWSPAARVSYRPLNIEVLPVLEAGKTATFVMGWDKGTARGKPEHKIVLRRPYGLGKYEVTNGLFAEVANRFLETGTLAVKDGSLVGPEGMVYLGLQDLNYGRQVGVEFKDEKLAPKEGRENHPVFGVTWFGAAAFCNGLSVLFGFEPVFDAEGNADLSAGGFRLPTEAEWEYAARGEHGWLFPQGRGIDNRAANYFKSWDPFEPVGADMAERGGPTTPAGFYDGRVKNGYQTRDGRTPFGHADMLGNVWEWCWDRFDSGYYEKSPQTDPEGPAAGDARSVRGCGWNTQADDVVLTSRGFYKPEGKSWSIGFRLARTLIP